MALSYLRAIFDEDFSKIDPTGKAARIFAAIPAQLNNNASRYQISRVIAGSHAEDFIELISEMEKAKTVNISHHSDDPLFSFCMEKSKKRATQETRFRPQRT